MVRQSLTGIPQFALPGGYEVLWYEAGFEKHWLDIHLLADADKYHGFTQATFVEKFGTDGQLLAQRQCYLADSQGRIFGTASAWFDDEFFGERVGLVHYVAIRPEMQGKGLAKPLLAIVCNRLAELGHTRALLRTATVRISAVNLYIKFGFEPAIRTAEDMAAWVSIQDKLKKPLDLDSFATSLAD